MDVGISECGYRHIGRFMKRGVKLGSRTKTWDRDRG